MLSGLGIITASMAKLMNYLTVHDFLWLNLEATKTPQRWNFARLEEAVFYQYGHGQSTDLVKQAARFITGWTRMRPFTAGNDACAFVGLLGFIRINNHDLNLSPEEALDWVRGIWADPSTAEAAIADRLTEGHLHLDHGVPPSREVLGHVKKEYAETVRVLVEEEAPVPIGQFTNSRLTAELN